MYHFGMRKISEVLQKLMSHYKMDSAYDVERRTGVSQPTAHRILSDPDYSPRANTVKKLAKGFGITEAQMHGFELLAFEHDKNGRTETYATQNDLIESEAVGGYSSLTRRIPVLDRDQSKNWKESIESVGTENGMIILISDEVPVTENTFGHLVTGDSMKGEFEEGDRVAINPDVEPKNGNFVLAEIAGDVVIRKFVSEAGDTRLVPLNDDYLKKDLRESKIIGVVSAKQSKPKVYLYK